MDVLTRKMIAEARACKPELSRTEVGTMLAGAVMRHLSLDRVRKVDIVEQDGNFWGNVVFDMPPGMPDMLGTPDAMPRRTREEALSDAEGILQLARMAERMRMPGEAEVTTRMFEIDRVAVEIPGDLFDMAAPEDPGAEDPQDLLRVMDELVEVMAGGQPLETTTLGAAGDRARVALGFLMARALHHGIFRHRSPAMEREMALPPEEEGSGPQPG